MHSYMDFAQKSLTICYGSTFTVLQLESISTAFYEQLFCQFPFAKILQTQTVSTEKLLKTLVYKKAAYKMLVKSTSRFPTSNHLLAECNSADSLNNLWCLMLLARSCWETNFDQLVIISRYEEMLKWLLIVFQLLFYTYRFLIKGN